MSTPSRGAHPCQTTSRGSACPAARIVNDFSVASTKLSSLLGHLVKTCQLLLYHRKVSSKIRKSQSKYLKNAILHKRSSPPYSVSLQSVYISRSKRHLTPRWRSERPCLIFRCGNFSPALKRLQPTRSRRN